MFCLSGGHVGQSYGPVVPFAVNLNSAFFWTRKFPFKVTQTCRRVDVRIDEKVLVKDLVKDDHWSASKVVRERLANRVRESNFFVAKDFDRKAPQLGGRKFRERYAMFLRKIGWQKGSANRRAKVSRKITFFSWRMAVLSRKNIDRSSCSLIRETAQLVVK